jgi:hypothetical protein
MADFSNFRDFALSESTGKRGRYLQRVSKAIYEAFFPEMLKILKEKREGAFTFVNAPVSYFANFFDTGIVRAVTTILSSVAAVAGASATKQHAMILPAVFAGPALFNYVSRLFNYHTSYKISTPDVDVNGEKVSIGPVSITMVISPKYKGRIREVTGAYNAGGGKISSKILGNKLNITMLVSPDSSIEENKQDLISVIEHEVTHKWQASNGDYGANYSKSYAAYRQEPNEIEASYQEYLGKAKRTGQFVGNVIHQNLRDSKFEMDELRKTMRLYILHALKYYPNEVFYRNGEEDLKPAEALRKFDNKGKVSQ